MTDLINNIIYLYYKKLYIYVYYLSKDEMYK